VKPGGGKGKGSGFERKVCVTLSRFVDPGGEDTIFWRSAMSGGRATVQGRKGIANKTQLGDITCVHEKGAFLTEMFVIECKFYGNLDLVAFLFKGKGKLREFWDVLVKQADKHGKNPLLIARQNRLDTLMLTTEKGKACLKTFGIKPAHIMRLKLKGYGPEVVIGFFDKAFAHT
jgi:hypothetical protein